MRNLGISMSDIDLIFRETSRQKEEDRVEFFFNQFEGLDDDSIMELWEYYLDEAMQTAYSSGIDKTIGFNHLYGYDTELEEL